MKFSTFVCCGLIAAGGAAPVLASPFGEGAGFSLLVQAQRPGPGREREAEKPRPRRDMRGSGDAERGRMNPDERRQLRRDIQDAGKDIYPQAPQRRGEGRRSGRRGTQ
ncbi:MAG: hypothetical protein AAB150_12035 [Pseudomonadota bacterium]